MGCVGTRAVAAEAAVLLTRAVVDGEIEHQREAPAEFLRQHLVAVQVIAAIAQFLQLWAMLHDKGNLADEDDSFKWRLTANGQYTVASAYRARFHGSIEADYAKALWSSKAPLKEKIFCWLLMRNRCWTADRLAKRGLQGPVVCTLCDQEPETLDHLMTGCSFSKSF